jgi:hypothetical protein
MNPVSPQNWFLKCGIAAGLSLLVYAAIAIAGPKAPPLPTSRDGALTVLDRYMQEPVPSVLLVGSSLTTRLNEAYFDTPDLRVIGLAGGSPITALEVALARNRLPKTILIEMNILVRGEDPVLVQKFSGGATSTWPRPIRSAIAFYERWLHGPPDRRQARADSAALLRGPPSDFDSRIYADRAFHQSDAEDPTVAVRENVTRMEQLIAAIEKRGARVLLYELPYSEQLEGSRSARITREIVHSKFPDPDRWLHIDFTRSELRWADGVHLDERSALIVAQSIDRALSSLLGQRD